MEKENRRRIEEEKRNDTKGVTDSRSALFTLIILSSTLLAVMFSETMLLPAIPEIMRDFNIPYSTSAWIFSAYLIVAAVMTPIAGKLSDLFGRKPMLMVGDGTTDVSLLHVDAKSRGVTTRRLPGFLSWQCEVTFDNVQVPAAAMLGEAQRGWTSLSRALERALPLLCSDIVGGCQAVYEKSVLYTQTRVQFGVPIGRFQRVQDHVVKLVNHLDSARWATWEALWKLDTGRPATASVHMAKAVASEAYLEACNAAHEVHAGMGVLVEYGLPAHTQMSRTLFHYLGDPRWHKRRMADALEW